MVVNDVDESANEHGPLDAERRDHHVEADRREAVTLQKCHQEAKANEDHHMDVLKYCGKQDKIKTWILGHCGEQNEMLTWLLEHCGIQNNLNIMDVT